MTATYTHDANGNRVTEDGSTVVGTYDAQDRLVSYGGTTYAHDANGNRVAETSSAGTKTYEHDAQGTLRAATVGGTTVKYVVDGSARRMARVENDVTTHQWLYRDDLQIAAELDGAGAVRWRFVYATGRHVPDAAIDGAGVAYRIVTDQVGSLRLVVRASAGGVVQRMRHGAWGRAKLGKQSRRADEEEREGGEARVDALVALLAGGDEDDDVAGEEGAGVRS